MKKMSTTELQIAERVYQQRNRFKRNRMRESRSYGSVGERGGNEPLYPEVIINMSRLFILQLIGSLSLFLWSLNSLGTGHKQPNFIVLIGDDISANSIGCYGAENKGVTPNIDKLAKEGVIFSNMFVSEAMCAPTRAELYTGLQPVRNGCYQNHKATYTGTKSVVHYLSELGYRVGLTGKTHFSPKSVYPFEKLNGFPTKCNSRNQSTEDWTEVERFIQRDSEEPFCLFLCSIHAHSPWDAGDADNWNEDEILLPPHFANTKETRLQFREYLAEVNLFDKQVGKTLEMIKRLKLDENTIFIVLDENGAGMPGGKWSSYDWGVRSACVMKWPERYEANTKTNVLAQYCDILPTMIEAAGGTQPQNLDGKSLLNVITSKESEHREYAFFVHNNVPAGPSFPIRGVTDGKFKLIWNLSPDSIFAAKTINGFEVGYEDKMLDRPERFIYLSWLEKAKHNKHAREMVSRHKNRPEFELYNLDKDMWELENLIENEKYKADFDRLNLVLKNWMTEQGDEGKTLDVAFN
jgi:N-sulfoglucosamine sulfohydrolase